MRESRPRMARADIGDVSLTAGISEILAHLGRSVVPGNSPLGQRETEPILTHSGEFGSLAKRKQSPLIQRRGKLQKNPVAEFGLRQLQCPLDLIRHLDRYGHIAYILTAPQFRKLLDRFERFVLPSSRRGLPAPNS